jgi:hypothetical protein
MTQEDAHLFIEAMQKEVADHELQKPLDYSPSLNCSQNCYVICVAQSDTTYDTYDRMTYYLSSAHKQTERLL